MKKKFSRYISGVFIFGISFCNSEYRIEKKHDILNCDKTALAELLVDNMNRISLNEYRLYSYQKCVERAKYNVPVGKIINLL